MLLCRKQVVDRAFYLMRENDRQRKFLYFTEFNGVDQWKTLFTEPKLFWSENNLIVLHTDQLHWFWTNILFINELLYERKLAPN